MAQLDDDHRPLRAHCVPMVIGRRMPRAPQRALLIAALLAVAACDSPKPVPSGQPAPTSTGSAAPAEPSPSPGSSAGPSPSASPAALHGDPATAADVRLSEVLYAPKAGATPFIEVMNIADHPVDLAGLVLGIEGETAPIRLAGVIAAGAALRVDVDALQPDGVITLGDGSATAFDRVAWGHRPLAVSTGSGDLVPEHVAAGSSIGRPPGADDVLQQLDWVVYPPDDVSPGVANPLPGVEVMLPDDGAIFDAPGGTLSWYEVVGAASYRLQIGTTESFANPVVDMSTTDPTYPVATLAPGAYLWRVAAVTAAGATGPLSAPIGFTVAPGATAVVSTGLATTTGGQASLTASTQGRQLSVPYLTQHKDTRMLLLESPVEFGQHAWDKDHGSPSIGDPADTKNCAIAAVAIMNHKFGGNMSQDRLGYEVLHDRQPGPEEDLMWGTGLTAQDATTMLNFALGGGVSYVPGYQNFNDYFDDVRAQLDAGRPVMSANSRHTFVITGYQIVNGHRILSYADPANGHYTRDLDSPGIQRADPTDYSVWITPAHPTGEHQEAGVTQDSDGDGVVDFDETERFYTNPTDKDTDADKLPDKADIVTGVFDVRYGYAFHGGDMGRDFDHDGVATELDQDSDAGDCWDGEEDTSKNGHQNADETYNFDKTDDVCMKFRVTITWNEVYNGKTDTFKFVGLIDTVEPGANPGGTFMTGDGTVEGSRRAWAACSVNITPPSGKGNAFFGGTIIGDTITVGAFAVDGPLAGVNTREFEMPKDGGTQHFLSDILPSSDLCPYSWYATVTVDALIAH